LTKVIAFPKQNKIKKESQSPLNRNNYKNNIIFLFKKRPTRTVSLFSGHEVDLVRLKKMKDLFMLDVH